MCAHTRTFYPFIEKQLGDKQSGRVRDGAREKKNENERVTKVLKYVIVVGMICFLSGSSASMERMYSKHPPCVTPESHIRLQVEISSNWSD